MKFFNSTGAASSIEDVAAATRLRGIVSRGQAQVCLQLSAGPTVEIDGARRRFWTPGELEAESGGE